AYAHQDLPFERLVDVLNPDRDLSRHPLFQVLFTMDNRVDRGLQVKDLVSTSLSRGESFAKFDLSVALHEHGGEVRASLGYATDLYDRATAERLLNHWLQLLTRMAANPG